MPERGGGKREKKRDETKEMLHVEENGKQRGDLCRQRGREKNEGRGEEENGRKPHVHTRSVLLRSPATLQVSSCDLGGFDRSGSPW